MCTLWANDDGLNIETSWKGIHKIYVPTGGGKGGGGRAGHVNGGCEEAGRGAFFRLEYFTI